MYGVERALAHQRVHRRRQEGKTARLLCAALQLTYKCGDEGGTGVSSDQTLQAVVIAQRLQVKHHSRRDKAHSPASQADGRHQPTHPALLRPTGVNALDDEGVAGL
jgi:hypothetical protein